MQYKILMKKIIMLKVIELLLKHNLSFKYEGDCIQELESFEIGLKLFEQGGKAFLSVNGFNKSYKSLIIENIEDILSIIENEIKHC